MNEDVALKAICLTERHIRTSSAMAAAAGGGGEPRPAPAPQLPGTTNGRTPHMRMAATILEAYEFKLQAVHVSCARRKWAGVQRNWLLRWACTAPNTSWFTRAALRPPVYSPAEQLKGAAGEH